MLAKLVDALAGDDIAVHPLDQKHRNRDGGANRVQMIAKGQRFDEVGGGEECRVPVPIQPTIVMSPQVFHQAADVLGAGPVRFVGGDRIPRLLEVIEAVHMALQKIHDLLGAFGVESRHHIDQDDGTYRRSEEHTSELQSLMRISYAVFCLKKKKNIENRID